MTYPITQYQGETQPYPVEGELVPQSAQGSITPAQQFLGELQALREATLQNTAMLAQYRQAPPPVPWHQPQPPAMAPYQAPTYQAPQYHHAAPTYQAPQYGQYAPQFNPTIVVHASANSRSEQDNSGGNCWWGLAFLAIFSLPFAAALVGGSR